MIVLLSYVMVAVVLLKVAMQPESHNCPMERREFWSDGMVWASCAAVGSDGWSWMIALWPILLDSVAVVLCSGPGFKHVVLS